VFGGSFVLGEHGAAAPMYRPNTGLSIVALPGEHDGHGTWPGGDGEGSQQQVGRRARRRQLSGVNEPNRCGRGDDQVSCRWDDEDVAALETVAVAGGADAEGARAGEGFRCCETRTAAGMSPGSAARTWVSEPVTIPV
jgi:hypothetical protein